MKSSPAKAMWHPHASGALEVVKGIKLKFSSLPDVTGNVASEHFMELAVAAP